MAISFVDDGAELRRALLDEFRSAAADVRHAAADTDESLSGAVHDYRKGLRRARALFRLVDGELPKRDRREIDRALTEARRALGATRDHAVANDVLGEIAGDEERDIAKAVLDRAAETAQSSAEIKQLLAEGATRTAAQVELLEAVLPALVDWNVVVEGVRSTYGRARRARKAAKRSRHAFHAWRRRSKELAIQLDALARIAVPEIAELRNRIVASTDELGAAVDLLMARDFVRAHDNGKAGDLLARMLTRELDEKIREGRRSGREAFRKKPGALARKLTKVAKRDVMPVAPPPSIGDEEFAVT